jgi:peptide/nickel transport system ATP-binding protein
MADSADWDRWRGMAEHLEPDGHLLRVQNLNVAFTGEAGIVHAVRGASFVLNAGKTFAVVGESGSGKSVTAQAIMGILPHNGRITAGSLLFRQGLSDGTVDLARLPQESKAMRAIRGDRIAMIFQEPMSSFSPVHSIGNQVTEALRIHTKVSAKEAAGAAMALFERVGFHDPKAMLTTYPFELSGGMRQRAMIAMALICNPALLIADEPTTALDVTTQAQILQLIKDLQAERGMAVMLITHDLGVVASMADEIAVMYRGEVMESGSREQIFRDPRHPYLQALMRAVPRFHMEAGERLIPLREIKLPPAALNAVARPSAVPRDVLSVERVSKSFMPRGSFWARHITSIHALTDVSFALKAGCTLGLVGESGSGKTTLARIIMRALQPDSGRVCFDDGSGPLDLAGLDAARLKAFRRTVQFVFQDPHSSLNPRMTVQDILTEPLAIHGIGSPAERLDRVASLIELVGLHRRHLKRYPHSFSGGQRQRIGLARALALSPSVIICDEPTSALDVSVQAQVLNLLHDLQAQLGLSYLFVSHNLAVVDYMADDIVVLCRGLVVERAPRERLFRAPQHPYTQALIAAVPEPDIDYPLDSASVKAGIGPADWPAPFRIGQDPAFSRMVEVAPEHFVRIGDETLGRLEA